jgi:rhodanese-related sulfurtransferase
MGPINLLGPTPMPDMAIPSIDRQDLPAMEDQVHIVDGRPRAEFAAGHIPGSIGIELSEQFGVWTGWLVPFGTPLVLVLDPGQDLAEALVQLRRIGFDDVRGVIWGLEDWDTAAQPLASFDTVDAAQAAAAIREGRVGQLLDVRSPGEWGDGHLDDAVHGYVPDLVDGLPGDLSPDEVVWVACASGYRATIAAGLVERAGFRPIVVNQGGVPEIMLRLTEVRAA